MIRPDHSTMARGVLRLTQRQVAEELGVSVATVCNFETGCGVSKAMNAFFQAYYEGKGVIFEEDAEFISVRIRKARHHA